MENEADALKSTWKSKYDDKIISTHNESSITRICNENDQTQIQVVHFKCEKCDQSFKDDEIREKHVLEAHCINPDICDFGVCLCYFYLKHNLVARSHCSPVSHRGAHGAGGQSGVHCVFRLCNIEPETRNHTSDFC